MSQLERLVLAAALGALQRGSPDAYSNNLTATRVLCMLHYIVLNTTRSASVMCPLLHLQAANWEAGTTLSTISSMDDESGHGSKSRNGNGNSDNMERHPPGKKHHTAAHPGSWRLKDDKLKLDQASQLPPLMLVSWV